MKKIAFIFPGQGAQYSKMGLDFFNEFPLARQTFEEADDILKRSLTKIIFEGSDQELTQTKNSQPAIFVTSYAMLRVLQSLFPEIIATHTAGLSLGEYTALTAAGVVSFAEALPLVQARGSYMHDCCEKIEGKMAVVLGLDDAVCEACVDELQLPNDIWAANFNCPGQVVISGTARGIEAASSALLQRGAKKILPLQVHGAFHSGLMQEAADRLSPIIETIPFQKPNMKIAMNVTGDFVTMPEQMKDLLKQQVTKSVRWSRCVRAIDNDGISLFMEIGCGKTLSGMNKRIGVSAETLSIEKVDDLKTIETRINSHGA